MPVLIASFDAQTGDPIVVLSTQYAGRVTDALSMVRQGNHTVIQVTRGVTVIQEKTYESVALRALLAHGLDDESLIDFPHAAISDLIAGMKRLDDLQAEEEAC